MWPNVYAKISTGNVHSAVSWLLAHSSQYPFTSPGSLPCAKRGIKAYWIGIPGMEHCFKTHSTTLPSSTVSVECKHADLEETSSGFCSIRHHTTCRLDSTTSPSFSVADSAANDWESVLLTGFGLMRGSFWQSFHPLRFLIPVAILGAQLLDATYQVARALSTKYYSHYQGLVFQYMRLDSLL